MILQTCGRLDSDINENGCYFMSILFHASQRTGMSFHAEDIMTLKGIAVNAGYLREDCYVIDPEKIFHMAGLKVRYTGKHESARREVKSNEIGISYFRWKEYGHFVAACRGIVLYDPAGVSNSVLFGSLVSQRIFELVA